MAPTNQKGVSKEDTLPIRELNQQPTFNSANPSASNSPEINMSKLSEPTKQKNSEKQKGRRGKFEPAIEKKPSYHDINIEKDISMADYGDFITDDGAITDHDDKLSEAESEGHLSMDLNEPTFDKPPTGSTKKDIEDHYQAQLKMQQERFKAVFGRHKGREEAKQDREKKKFVAQMETVEDAVKELFQVAMENTEEVEKVKRKEWKELKRLEKEED